MQDCGRTPRICERLPRLSLDRHLGLSPALDVADSGGDAIGIGKRFIDRVSQLLHQILQAIVHIVPFLATFSISPGTRAVARKSTLTPTFLSATADAFYSKPRATRPQTS